MAFDVLFSPMNIGTITIKNRIVMTAASSDWGRPAASPPGGLWTITKSGQREAWGL